MAYCILAFWICVCFVFSPTVQAQDEQVSGYKVGSQVEVREGDQWSQASVVATEGRRIKIRYPDRVEEWVGGDRLRKLQNQKAGHPFAPSINPPAIDGVPPLPLGDPFSSKVEPQRPPATFGEPLTPSVEKAPRKSIDAQARKFTPDPEPKQNGEFFTGDISLPASNAQGFDPLGVYLSDSQMLVVSPGRIGIGAQKTMVYGMSLPEGQTKFKWELPESVKFSAVNRDQSLACVTWLNAYPTAFDLNPTAQTKARPDLAVVSVWKMKPDGDVERMVSFSPPGQPRAIFFGSDVVLLVAVGEILYAYSIPAGKSIWQMTIGKDSNLVFSRTGKQFAINRFQGIGVFDSATGNAVAQLHQNKQQFGFSSTVSFASNGEELAEVFGNTFRIWDLAKEKIVDEVPNFGFNQGGFLDSRFLLAGDKLIDRKTQVIVWTFRNSPPVVPVTGMPYFRGRLWQIRSVMGGFNNESILVFSDLLTPEVLAAANGLKKESILAYQRPEPVSIVIKGADEHQAQAAFAALKQKLNEHKIPIEKNAKAICTLEFVEGRETVITIDRTRKENGRILQDRKDFPIKPKSLRFEMTLKDNTKLLEQDIHPAPGQIHLEDGQSIDDALAKAQSFDESWLTHLFIPPFIVHPDKLPGQGTTDLAKPPARQ